MVDEIIMFLNSGKGLVSCEIGRRGSKICKRRLRYRKHLPKKQTPYLVAGLLAAMSKNQSDISAINNCVIVSQWRPGGNLPAALGGDSTATLFYDLAK